ncbi:MAG: sigma factor-like helix-turn-helix DNA-binding protein, partial [Chloroflexota bacterium]
EDLAQALGRLPERQQEALRLKFEAGLSYAEIAGVLNPIFRTLDNVTLQSLNAAVEVDGENPTDVATTWLSENGFIGG